VTTFFRRGVADIISGLKRRGLVGSALHRAGTYRCRRARVASGAFDCAQVYYNLLNPVPPSAPSLLGGARL